MGNFHPPEYVCATRAKSLRFTWGERFLSTETPEEAQGKKAERADMAEKRQN